MYDENKERKKQEGTPTFGVVLYEATTCGDDPYPRMNDGEILSKLDAGYRMLCPTGCPEKLYTIMKKCWRKNVRVCELQLSQKYIV